jgi:crotonobetaine/carnitine-CoA ligase
VTTAEVPVLCELVAGWAAKAPDRLVLTIDVGPGCADEVRTYRQLWDDGRRLARGVQQLGLQRGHHFALLMANHPAAVEAMIAACLTGTVFVPIDPRTSGEKLRFMLAHAECRGVIAADYALANLDPVRAALPDLHWVVGLPTPECGAPLPAWARSWTDLVSGAVPDAPFEPAEPDSPMQLLYTSGTTGDPKAIRMTHRRWIENALAVPRLCGWQSDEKPYSGLSLTHANAQVLTMGACLANGVPCVLSRRFTKSRLWDVTRRHGCTTFNLLGGMTTAIYSEPPRPDDADNPVRFVLSAGMPAAIWKDFERRFGVQVFEFYGAAEGGMAFKPVGVGPVGSIGRPVPSLHYRIVDDAGNDVPRGTPGELLFRHADGSPFVVEYYRDPVASAKKCEGGWLHMGDVVVEDEDGWLFFLYRKGGGIRRNGDFINPSFVEKVIGAQPDVDDVYVYGIAAASGAPGEKDVVAAVVPREATTFDPQALFKVCRRELEPNAVPSLIQVLGQIPKTASEKPQDRFLIEALQSQPSAVHRERA